MHGFLQGKTFCEGQAAADLDDALTQRVLDAAAAGASSGMNAALQALYSRGADQPVAAVAAANGGAPSAEDAPHGAAASGAQVHSANTCAFLLKNDLWCQ